MCSSTCDRVCLCLKYTWYQTHTVSPQAFWMERSQHIRGNWALKASHRIKVSRTEKKKKDGCLPCCKALNHYHHLHAILHKRTHTGTQHLASTVMCHRNEITDSQSLVCCYLGHLPCYCRSPKAFLESKLGQATYITNSYFTSGGKVLSYFKCVIYIKWMFMNCKISNKELFDPFNCYTKDSNLNWSAVL